MKPDRLVLVQTGVFEGSHTLAESFSEMQGRPVELVRKESLSSLTYAAAQRVIARTYSAVITIDPLPLPALPVPLSNPGGPAYFGASAIMMSPWLMLAILQHLQRGPVCFACVAGQRITTLPPQVSASFSWTCTLSDALRNIPNTCSSDTCLHCSRQHRCQSDTSWPLPARPARVSK